jgi:hypothetical protein
MGGGAFLPRRGRLLLRVVVLAFVAVAVASFVVPPLTGHVAGQFDDYTAYRDAAKLMAQGRSPYDLFIPHGVVVLGGFDYPPFAAVLVRPLAMVSDQVAMIAWLWLGLACTVAAALIVACTALPASWPRTELALLAARAFPPC